MKPSEHPNTAPTLENCLSAYATCVFNRAAEVGQGNMAGIAVLEERMRIEQACRFAILMLAKSPSQEQGL